MPDGFPTSDIVFETLQAHHDRQSFDCGEVSLNNFLHKQARQNADRNLGVTHVAVAKVESSRVLAYYTLVTRTVLSETMSRKGLPTGEIGVVLLGRLAVDLSAQSSGLGRLCLLRAAHQVERASREIGIHAMVVHALNESAREWYLRQPLDFETFLDNPNHIFLLISTLKKALTSSG